MKLTTKAEATFTFHLIITEGEMRALDALVGYGFDEFIKVFYEKLGKAYMESHEQHLKNLFGRINELRPHLDMVNQHKKAIEEAGKKYSL